MTEPAHYSHGPSSASRWLICTDSPFAQEGYPDETTDAADEGTAAHWLLEQCLNSGKDAEAFIYSGETNGILWAGENALVPANEETGCKKNWPITGEMLEAVQLHIDTVKPDALKKGTRMFVEERVRIDQHLSLEHPVGGTADTILYLPRSKTLKVIDFKYGRGHVVEVGDTERGVNPQLGIYALAALAELERLMGEKREVKWIELIIVQPRAFHKDGPVRKKKIAPLQLLRLEASVVKAVSGERVRVAGDHCHFCRAKPDCEAFASHRHATATADFAADAPEEKSIVPTGCPDAVPDAVHEAAAAFAVSLPGLLTRPVKGLNLNDLARARQVLSHLRAWASEVEAEVKTRLLHDLKVPGARLGVGRGSRSFGGTPEEIAAAVEATADELALDVDTFYKPADLKSAAALEKELGKKKFKGTPLAKLVTRQEGGPMVVDEDSDTPAWAPGNAFEGEAEKAPEEVKHHLL